MMVTVGSGKDRRVVFPSACYLFWADCRPVATVICAVEVCGRLQLKKTIEPAACHPSFDPFNDFVILDIAGPHRGRQGPDLEK